VIIPPVYEPGALLDAIFQQSCAGVVLVNASGYFIGVNPRFCKITGYPESELLERTFGSITHPDDLAADLQQAERLYKGEIDSYELEKRYIRKSGDFVWVYISCSLVKTPVGIKQENPPEIPLGLAVVQDISLRKQREAELIESQKKLEASEAHFRFVTDSVPIMIWLKDANLKATYINQAWQQFTGLTPKEILQSGWLDKIHPDDRESVQQGFWKTVEQRHPISLEYRLSRKDGQYRYMSEEGIPLITESGDFQGYIGYIIDITERKQAEFLISQSETSWRVLANSIPQHAWMADADGHRSWFNQPYLDYTGSTIEESQGWGWTSFIREDQAETLVENIRLASQTKAPFEATVAIRSKDGQYRWFLSRALPIVNADGEIARWFGTNTDINELREIQEALERSQRQLAISNRDLAQFAAIASHDLQAPLRKAKSFCDMIRPKIQDQLDPETSNLMGRIHASLESMQSLVSDLLSLSLVSTESQTFDYIDLSQILARVMSTLSDLIDETNAIIQVGQLAQVYGDGEQLTLLLQNLLENAIKYQPAGQRPQVAIEAINPENHWCQISVRDNGIGFPQSQVDRIFRPFERLHGKSSAYHGNGIGLAICHRIVERHNGQIWATSNPGQGSLFVVQLPLQAPTSS
jgi:PAS domain S-box-containing protein